MAPSSFDGAVQAVINGDEAELRRLLDREPDLVHARSPSPHRCTLLHYVGANGVENELQKSPANAVEIAGALLDAGAEVDATAETYGGGPRQTTLNAVVTSVWPYLAGVQADMVDRLLDAGAAVDGLTGDGFPVRVALSFGYPTAAKRLQDRGCRVDRLDVAAGLGQLERMERMLAEDPPDRDLLESAFRLACGNGQIEAADLLLRQGVEIDWQLGGEGTGLHHAILHGEGGEAPDGRIAMVRFLIESGADQNVQHGKYDATALDFASYNGRREIVVYLLSQGATDIDEALASAAARDHAEIVVLLLRAGAKPPQSMVADLRANGKGEIARLLGD
mgnify:CR=1 FL=1